VTSELRQLRRVRWGVRLTLALGISASLAANVLHARHLLIDQIISGWPPVAVFATIEAIARVPIHRRWLAGIRMTGLGFVAGIAFWVSYWHMASVAAEHGENGSKYLLPLSVDGLVVVSSISLVELTDQISAAEATARAATAVAATQPPPVQPRGAEPSPAEHRMRPHVPAPLPPVSTVLPDGHRPPDLEPAPPAVAPAIPRTVEPAALLLATPPVTIISAPTGGAPAEPVPADAQPSAQRRADTPAPRTAATVEPAVEPTVVVEPVAEPVAAAKHGEDRTDGGADDRAKGRADEVPPDNPSEAILWWRDKDPTLTLTQIAAKVGRSERTVRRTIDSATASVVPAGPGQPAGEGATPKRPTNGAAVDGLTGSVAPT
jgi:hypothetical protein